MTIEFNKLPKEVQGEIKELLGAYPKANVIFENGEYKVGAGVGIYSTYADDYKFINSFTAEEIFNKEERIINYFMNFHSFSSEYNGERDWKLVQEAKDRGYYEDRLEVKLENGNIVRA